MQKPNNLFKSDVFRKRIPDQASVIILVALAAFFFWPILFEGKTLFYRDVLMYIIPEKFFIASAFQEGAWPFWNSAYFSGMPFMGLLHPSPTYPLNFIFALGDVISGFNYFIFVNYLILVLSVYALIRFWGMSCPVALISAVMAAFGGYYLSLVSLGNHYLSMVWTPLILLTFQKFLLGGRVSYFIFAIVFLTFQTLGGSPENCILSTFILYFSSIFLVSGNAHITGWQPRTLAVGGLVISALGLSAFQLLPTYAVIQNSVRVWDLSVDYNTLWSLEPQTLTSLFFPKDLAGFMERVNVKGAKIEEISFLPSIFMGVIPIFFLFSGVLLFKTKEIRFWTVTFFVGIFFALGKYNPIYLFLFSHVPLLDMFRYPEKFFFLSAFSLIFLSAFWLKEFAKSPVEGKYKLKPLLFLAFIFCVGIIGIGGWVHWRNALMTFVCFFAFVFACRLFYSGALKGPQFKGAVLALLALDLITRNFMLVPMIDRDFFDKEPAVAPAAGKYEAGYRIYSGSVYDMKFPDRSLFPLAPNLLFSHIFEKEQLFPNLGAVYGFEYADGLTGVKLQDNWLWAELFNEFSPENRIRMLERCNVKYWVTPENDDSPQNLNSPIPLKKVKILNGVLPRAFIVNKVTQDSQPYKTYFDEAFDPLSEALLYEKVTLDFKENFEGRVKTIIYTPNHVTIESEQNGEGLLILLDSYFPGWKVKVNGKNETLYRANHFYRAVKLGPGEHKIEFGFEPIGFRAGLGVSSVTLLLIASLGIWTIFSKRKHK